MEEVVMSHMPKGRVEATTILVIVGEIWAWKSFSRARCPRGATKQLQPCHFKEMCGHGSRPFASHAQLRN